MSVEPVSKHPRVPAGWQWQERLAEPGRATSRRFVAEAAAAGWRSDRDDFERDWPAGVGHAAVTVHRYTHLPWREHDR